MARKALNTIRSKGERLGWLPLDKVCNTPLSLVAVSGRRLRVVQQSEVSVENSTTRKLIIP